MNKLLATLYDIMFLSGRMGRYNLSSYKRAFVHYWQRLTRGWDDSDTYNLDARISEFLIPRLKRFKELNRAYPGEFSTPEEWDVILDKMIKAFELHLVDTANWHLSPEETEGMELFVKYYRGLWW